MIINSSDPDNEFASFILFEEIANANTENNIYKQLLEDYNLSSIDINDLIKVTFKKNICDMTNILLIFLKILLQFRKWRLACNKDPYYSKLDLSFSIRPKVTWIQVGDQSPFSNL